MAGKIFRYSSKTLILCLEIAGAVVAVIALLAGLFMWRLASGPVDASFARDYIQQALRDPAGGYAVALGGIVLEWPDFRGPLMLDLKGLGFVRDGRTVLTVEGARLGLSGAHLLAGRAVPVSIVLDSPALRLIRTTENRISLFLDDGDAASEPEKEGPDPLARILDELSRPAGAGTPLGSLKGMEIRDASMIVEDHVLGITWYVRNLDMAFARDGRGLAVKAGLQLPGGRNQAATLQAEAVYSRDRKDFRVDLYLQDFDPRTLSHKVEALSFLDPHEIFVNGTVSLTLDSALAVTDGALSLYAEDGALGLPGVYAQPFPYQELRVEAAYDAANGLLTVGKLALRAQDVVMEASTTVEIGKDQVKAPVTILIPDLPQEKIPPLWPQALDDRPVKEWLTQRLSGGKFHDAAVSFDVTALRKPEGEEETWDVSVGNIKGAFGIAGMTVDYRAPLMPAKQAVGRGKYENDILDIEIDSATVGSLKAQKGRVVIDEISSDKVGTATITLALDGPLPEVFRYIADEPIDLKGEDIGISTADVKGDAHLDVKVSFPTLKDLPAEKVNVEVDGQLKDVVLPDVVKALDLTGGPLKLTVAEGMVGLEGNGKLDGRAVALNWKQYLESKGRDWSSRITATMDADAELREKLGIRLEDWLEGTMPVTVTYTEFGGGRAEAVVDGNATPLRLMVNPFAYEKPPGQQATAKCKVLLQDGWLTEVRDLDVQTPDLHMTGARFTFETVGGESVLRRGSVPRATLHETDAGLEVEVEKSGLLRVALKGSFLDARPFLKKRKDKTQPQDGPPVIASVDVGRMRTGDTRLVEKAKVYLDLDKDGLPNQMELDAIAGNGPIYFRLKPDNSGKMKFRMEAADAGATLRAFNVYENVRGGKLVMTGESPDIKRRHYIYGTATMTDFHVINAPVLAQLVGAIGITGLPQLLSGEGLFFAQLESKFSWYIRKPGDIYAINDGRTSGSSLGLTFEGKIDKAKNEIDIDGHVVPVSELNSLIGSIPLIGAILGGGEGAIFAATYSVTGPADKPEVSVNPLAVLAPGIIRRILFED